MLQIDAAFFTETQCMSVGLGPLDLEKMTWGWSQEHCLKLPPSCSSTSSWHSLYLLQSI